MNVSGPWYKLRESWNDDMYPVPHGTVPSVSLKVEEFELPEGNKTPWDLPDSLIRPLLAGSIPAGLVKPDCRCRDLHAAHLHFVYDEDAEYSGMPTIYVTFDR